MIVADGLYHHGEETGDDCAEGQKAEPGRAPGHEQVEPEPGGQPHFGQADVSGVPGGKKTREAAEEADEVGYHY